MRSCKSSALAHLFIKYFLWTHVFPPSLWIITNHATPAWVKCYLWQRKHYCYVTRSRDAGKLFFRSACPLVFHMCFPTNTGNTQWGSEHKGYVQLGYYLLLLFGIEKKNLWRLNWFKHNKCDFIFSFITLNHLRPGLPQEPLILLKWT